MSEPLRWGVLSTARIATAKVVPALLAPREANEPGHRVVAIASRQADRAEAVAKRLGIAGHYGSYQALLDDAAVEAVYIPLPNHLHVPWAVAALRAGKHVLCEKPLALNAAEAATLVAEAAARPRLKIMEAFMYRFHPQWIAARDLVASGGLGELRTIQTMFSFYNDDPANVRHNPAWGGGALMDIGCYAVSLSRWLIGRQPRRVMAITDIDPRFGVDRAVTAVLDFGDGLTSSFVCSMRQAPRQAVEIIGTQGRLELSDVPFNAPPDRPCRVRYFTGHDGPHGTPAEDILTPAVDQYARQADLMARAIRQDRAVPTPLTDAVANMAVIDALLASGAAHGAWVSASDVPSRP